MTAAWPVALAAAALFALEPFAAKVLLPRLGGTPMVWNTCMFVFQTLLVLGAAAAARLAPGVHAARRYRVVALAVFALWPFAIRALWWPPPAGVPAVAWIAGVLTVAIGPPFVLLAATSPLLQVWSRGPEAHRLYAVSNLGSAAGLVLYVAVVEPVSGLHAQAWLLWVVAALACAGTWRVAVARPAAPSMPPASVATEPAMPVRPSRPWLWASASFAASFALFSVNTYLATDVASFPLLFVLPLIVFLGAFALGFSARVERRAAIVDAGAAVTVGVALFYLFEVATLSTSVKDVPWPLLALGGVVTLLAGRLAASRPPADALPRFYLIIGLGGIAAGAVSVLVIPGAWMALAAPFAGSRSWLASAAVPEFPVALALGLIVGGRRWIGRAAGLAACAWVALATAPDYGLDIVYQARNFYGTLRVQSDPSSGTHRLQNGTTLHGFEVLGTDRPQATSYYHPASPIGQVMRALGPRHVMAMGLGAGTLAAYARPGDRYVFLEINPLVEQVATTSGLFSFVPRARARGAEVEVRLGDGRQSAGVLPAGDWDLIVLDAFSSDSIPVHLLTLEAFREYGSKLSARGVIAVHVSNRFFDLGPVAAAAAGRFGWTWAIQSRREAEGDETPSTWLMMAASPQAADTAGLTSGDWTRPVVPPGVKPWTDDWANLLIRLKILSPLLGGSFAD